jgi:hypothetical protein
MSDNTNSPNDSASAGAVVTPDAAPAAGGTIDEVATLREQMLVDRFDAVAARAGIAEDYTEVALELFRKTGKEPTRETLAAFCKDLKAKRPALFGPQPASTAPTQTTAVPAAPAPGAVSTPYEQWRALLAAGRKPEAQAFYAQHRAAINRAAQ